MTASITTPGAFKKTITLGAADTPQQLSALMIAKQPGAWVHGAELNIFGVAGNTAPIYIGDSGMVSPGAGLAPVDYIWALDGDGNPYNSGGGRDNNFTHCGDYWVMSTAGTQKIRVELTVG